MFNKNSFILGLCLTVSSGLVNANDYENLNPNGFTQYCNNVSAIECGNKSQKYISDVSFESLEKINTYVNKNMVYQQDLLTHNKREYWTDPVNFIGDCEDSVLKKIHMLHALGWDSKTLKIATVYFYDNFPITQAVLPQLGLSAANHAVLVVEFGNNKYVLDAITNKIVTIQDFKEVFGVQFVTIQNDTKQFVRY